MSNASTASHCKLYRIVELQLLCDGTVDEKTTERCWGSHVSTKATSAIWSLYGVMILDCMQIHLLTILKKYEDMRLYQKVDLWSIGYPLDPSASVFFGGTGLHLEKLIGCRSSWTLSRTRLEPKRPCGKTTGDGGKNRHLTGKHCRIVMKIHEIFSNWTFEVTDCTILCKP